MSLRHPLYKDTACVCEWAYVCVCLCLCVFVFVCEYVSYT